jgi:lipopolysaccharide transport system permease protein
MAVAPILLRLASPPSLLAKMGRETGYLVGGLLANRRALAAVTRVELRQRYAGSFLGTLWYPLYWTMLLGMYCFVYVVIFHQRLPEFSQFEYIVFIFAGLVPYFGLSDALASGTSSVRANMAFHRNVVFPVELIPVKAVLVALTSQAVAIAIVALLAVAAGFSGWHLLYLPVPFALEMLLIAGVVWVFSAANVLVPDIQQGITLALWFCLFMSPIGFTLAQVPDAFRWLLWLNPLSYLIEEFRYALLGVRSINIALSLPILAVLSLASFAFGSVVFRRLKGAFGDYE